MYTIILDDNQYEKINGMTPEFPFVVENVDMTSLEVPWHWHEEVEFKYVISGNLRVKTDKEEYLLKAGEAGFTNSDVIEMTEAVDKTEPSEALTILFHPALISGHFQSVFEKKYVKPVLTNRQIKMIRITPETEAGKGIIKNLLKIYALSEQKNKEFQIRNLLSDTWLLLIQEIEDQLNSRPAESIRGKDRIRYMLQYISQHYGEKLTLADIAESANISEREALRTFKKMLGKAPFDYLNEYRLSKARELLESTDQPVTEIAVGTGFSDSGKEAKWKVKILPFSC